jgi:hypothetical protein
MDDRSMHPPSGLQSLLDGDKMENLQRLRPKASKKDMLTLLKEFFEETVTGPK